MTPRPGYSLKHDIARLIKKANGDVEEQVVRTGGTTLDLRRTKVKTVREIQKVSDEVEQGMVLVAQATGLSMEDVGDMDLEDFEGVSAVIQGFTESGRKALAKAQAESAGQLT